MYFVGVDLAWGGRNPTGVAVIDTAGRLIHVTAVRDDDEVLAALSPYVGGDCVVAFDAPLVVTNPTGQRPAEAALNHDFRRFEAGAHPSNTSRPEFADSPRAGRLAAALGLDLDPRSSAPRRAIEVYPHPATVVLFRLQRTLKYKAKPGRTLDQLRSQLLVLMDGVETLAHADEPMSVHQLDGWAELRRQVVGAQRKSDLRRAEDPVDAVVCAYVALYAQRRPDGVAIYGDVATGCIVTPSLPPDMA
jgi:predicted RNase H-like nuclease